MVVKEKKLEDFFHEESNGSGYLLNRNLSYSAAGVEFIIVILLSQIWENSLVLEISLYSSIIGIPLWIGLGSILEYYISLGKQSYFYGRTDFSKALLGMLSLVGGISLIISFSSIIYYLNNISIYFFLLSCVIVVFLIMKFHYNIEKALLSQEKNNKLN